MPRLAGDALSSVQAQQALRVQAAREHLATLLPGLGISSLHTFKVLKADTDEFGLTHVHFAQHYLGVPVFEGAVITHLEANGQHREITNALVRDLDLNVQPSLTPAEAVAVAHEDLRPAGPYAQAPSAELVIYPVRVYTAKAGLAQPGNSDDFQHQVLRKVLAYHVHTSLRNPGETKDADYMVDAHTGQILKSWNDLHHAAASGTGVSEFSGTVQLSTSTATGGFSLTDTTRGNTVVKNMNNLTTGSGTLYTNSTNSWGNGANYYDNGTSGTTTSATGQTTAVDAQYGFQITWDFYKNVHGRNGIDGNGTATSLLVHYDKNYDNAYWDDACFCMTFGDGSAPASGGFKNLTAPDVIGHELSHGVCANNGHGGLTYSGESGGLNEADSDIQGTFVVYYGYNGGTGTTVPNTIPTASLHGYTPWTIGSQLSNPPLRYMYKPSLDGGSADYWSSTVGNLDVHYSSGPGNHMIYFLAQGATATGSTSSTYLPTGMTGIGNDHAARIWYRALTTYFTAGETYAQCRTACLSAASDLYGSGSADYAAVQNAFHGINVGAAAPTGVAVSVTPTTATLATGATFQFTAAVTGSTNTAVTWTATGGTVTSGGLYTAPASAGTFTVKATSAADTTKSASATVTVTSGATSQLILNPSFESGATSWLSSASVIGSNGTAQPAHTGSYEAWLCGYGSTHTDYVYQTVAIPATATSAALSYWLHIDTAETTTTSAYDLFKAQVRNSAGTVLATLSTVSNLNKAAGYKQYTFDLTAYKGQTVQIYFTGSEDSSLQTSFVLDDVNLTVH
jgi:Zn-dependent metalloprotease